MNALSPSARPSPLGHSDTPPCLFCGDPEQVEMFEVWGHEFMLQTCCESLHEQLVHEFNDDPQWAREYLRRLELESLCGRPLRRVADDGASGLILDWQLDLRPIPHQDVRAFVDRHHVHCRTPAVWRFHTSIWNGDSLIGVVLVGNAVARAFNDRGIVEVNRLCVRRDTPAALR